MNEKILVAALTQLAQARTLQSKLLLSELCKEIYTN